MPSEDNQATIPASPEYVGNRPKNISPLKSLQVCRYYCWGGFFLLPFLWLLNLIWFFPEAFGHADLYSGDPNDEIRPDETEREAEERKERIRNKARFYVTISGLGTLVSSIIIGVWVYLYQTRRSEWGSFGDYISVVIPRGKP